MKTEDIDKKIGMPDVNDEWAKFESEVINKEKVAPQKNRRTLYAWLGGMGIAASLLLFFVLSMKDELAEEPLLTAQTMLAEGVVEVEELEHAGEMAPRVGFQAVQVLAHLGIGNVHHVGEAVAVRADDQLGAGRM